MKATEKQVGGNHYSGMKMQPVELFAKTHCTAFQANIWKYIVRYKQKNGKEDVEKAKHYAQLAIELKCDGYLDKSDIKEVIQFCNMNNLPFDTISIILFAANNYYQGVIDACESLIAKEYTA